MTRSAEGGEKKGTVQIASGKAKNSKLARLTLKLKWPSSDTEFSERIWIALAEMLKAILTPEECTELLAKLETEQQRIFRQQNGEQVIPERKGGAHETENTGIPSASKKR